MADKPKTMKDAVGGALKQPLMENERPGHLLGVPEEEEKGKSTYQWENPEDDDKAGSGQYGGSSLPIDGRVRNVIKRTMKDDGTVDSMRLGPEFDAAHNARADAYRKAHSSQPK